MHSQAPVKVDLCETCQHFRKSTESNAPAQLLRRESVSLEPRGAEVTQALTALLEQDAHDAFAEKMAQLKHLDAGQDSWRGETPPRHLSYCGRDDGARPPVFHYVQRTLRVLPARLARDLYPGGEVVNIDQPSSPDGPPRALACPFWERRIAHLPCASCSHKRKGTFDVPHGVGKFAATLGLMPSEADASKTAMTAAVADLVQELQCHGSGIVPKQPNWLSWCGAKSTGQTYLVAAMRNPSDSCVDHSLRTAIESSSAGRASKLGPPRSERVTGRIRDWLLSTDLRSATPQPARTASSESAGSASTETRWRRVLRWLGSTDWSASREDSEHGRPKE